MTNQIFKTGVKIKRKNKLFLENYFYLFYNSLIFIKCKVFYLCKNICVIYTYTYNVRIYVNTML